MSMQNHQNPVDVIVPEGSRVSNYLYREMGLDELNQDLLVVILPNDVLIEVGWFPENDPAGHFHITASSVDGEIQSWNRSTVADVLLLVQRQAERLSKGVLDVSQSSMSARHPVSV